MKFQTVASLVKQAGVKFVDDKGPRLGAALAFYTALSLSPLLLAVVAIAGFVFGEDAARGEIVAQLRDTIGQEGATVIEQLIAKSAAATGKGLAAFAAFAVLFWGASSVFSELQSALNTIWQVPGRKSAGGIRTFFRERFFSFTLVCGVAFLLITSLVVSAILSAVNNRIAGWIPGMGVLAQVTNFVVTLALLTALFAMIFKVLPETRLAWSDVWLGAIVTAVLFSIGKYLIGLYLGQAAVGSAYGTAGAFVVLLVWMYWSTQLLLFGAELTFVYARHYGHGIGEVPAPQLAQSKLETAH